MILYTIYEHNQLVNKGLEIEGSLELGLEKGYLQEPQLQRWRNLKGRYRAP